MLLHTLEVEAACLRMPEMLVLSAARTQCHVYDIVLGDVGDTTRTLAIRCLETQ
jgi:hypothetical protein